MREGASPSPVSAAASSPPETLTFRTAAVDLDLAEPWGFLSSRPGPRGFWARGEGWVATGGVVDELRVDADPARAVGPERGARIRRIAEARALRHALPVPGGEVIPLRWFGGFSFAERSDGAGPWSAFPPALFQLPAFELRARPGGSTLIARMAATEDAGADALALDRRLHGMVEGLTTRGTDEYPLSGLPVDGPPETLGSREAWVGMVDEALAALERGDFTKVVLARAFRVETPEPLDPIGVVSRLLSGNPRAQVFLVEPTPGATFVGASPETLARVARGRFTATAVAGSTARGETPAEDVERARLLLASAKDRREQALVVDGMLERLADLVKDIRSDEAPHVLTLSGIQHLESLISARVPAGVDLLEIVAQLHPTPAVCGRPRDRAAEFLAAEERLDRGWYGGPVGWFDDRGDGVFAPALRCAVARGCEWHLFAGAGIVPGSDPDREWDETRLKLGTILEALAGTAGG